MANVRSLISQARQIRASVNQTDIDLGSENSARNTIVNGAAFLEEDLNHIRSMILDITGETSWSDNPAVTLKVAEEVTSKKLLQPIQYSGTIGDTDVNNLVTNLDAVPGITNTVDTDDLGYVVDDATTPSPGTKAYIALRDKVTNMPLLDENENTVFAVAYNDGNDKVQLKFFTDVDGTYTEYTMSANTSFEALLPNRQTISTINEDFAMANAGFADKVGAFEIGTRNWVDGNDNEGNATYGFIENEDITTVINKLAAIGVLDKNLGDNVSSVTGIDSSSFSTTFKTDNADSYFEDGDSYYTAFNKIDSQLKLNEEAIANASADRIAEILTADIAENTAHTLPQSKTYQNDDKDAMAVYITGQLMISDAMADANNSGDTGDYSETSTTEVTFAFPLETGDVIVYNIFKA
jgi:hypothetical protein